jgi:FkbM family methyltransferase
MNNQTSPEIIQQKLHSEVRSVARVVAGKHELLLDVSNGRLEIWAKHFADTEPELLDFIDALPETAIYYDVGASIGHFALYAAMRIRKVIALEPEALNFATASLNHFLNRERIAGDFVLLNVAASDVLAIEHLAINLYGAGEHTKALQRAGRSEGASDARPTLHRQPVLTFPLDELTSRFSLPEPTHLKIDVDGAEASVLAGAKRCLANRALKQVFIELEAGEVEQQCSRLLAEHGFTLSERHGVRRISGGYYEKLTNCVFVRNS